MKYHTLRVFFPNGAVEGKSRQSETHWMGLEDCWWSHGCDTNWSFTCSNETHPSLSMWLQNRLPYCKVYLQTAWTWLFSSLWGMQRTELFQCYEANTYGWCPRWWLNFDGKDIYSNNYVMKYYFCLSGTSFAQLTMSPLICWESNILQLQSLPYNTWVRTLYLSSFNVSLPSGGKLAGFSVTVKAHLHILQCHHHYFELAMLPSHSSPLKTWVKIPYLLSLDVSLLSYDKCMIFDNGGCSFEYFTMSWPLF